MSVLDITDYSYKIVSVDIENTTAVIEFKPADTDLATVTYNCDLQVADVSGFPDYENSEDIPFAEHLKLTATLHAPLGLWRRQKWAVLNGTALTNQIASNTFISVS